MNEIDELLLLVESGFDKELDTEFHLSLICLYGLSQKHPKEVSGHLKRDDSDFKAVFKRAVTDNELVRRPERKSEYVSDFFTVMVLMKRGVVVTEDKFFKSYIPLIKKVVGPHTKLMRGLVRPLINSRVFSDSYNTAKAIFLKKFKQNNLSKLIRKHDPSFSSQIADLNDLMTVTTDPDTKLKLQNKINKLQNEQYKQHKFKIEMKRWAKNLPQHEANAVTEYSGPLYEDIKNYQYDPSGTHPPSIVTLEADARAALAKSIKYEGIVYRGIADIKNIKERLNKYSVGKVVKSPAFHSYSQRYDVAHEFGVEQNSDADLPSIILVLEATGKKGVLMQSLSDHPEEAEVLFDVGLNMKILSVQKEKDEELDVVVYKINCVEV